MYSYIEGSSKAVTKAYIILELERNIVLGACRLLCRYISVRNQAFVSVRTAGSWAATAPAVVFRVLPLDWGRVRRSGPRGVLALRSGLVGRGAAATLVVRIASSTARSRPIIHIPSRLFCRTAATSWTGAAIPSTVMTSHWTAWPAPASVSSWVPKAMVVSSKFWATSEVTWLCTKSREKQGPDGKESSEKVPDLYSVQ